MAGKKKPVTTWTLTDLGVDPSAVGLAGAATAVRSADANPPRTAGEVVVDDGDGAARIADFLVSQKIL
jgi:electron transfer flavoprotein beta subunit